MTATLSDGTKKINAEPTAEQRAAEEMVRRTREQGLSLTGPYGLLKQLTKTVLETALNQEMTGHLGMRTTARPTRRAGRAERDQAQDGADRGGRPGHDRHAQGPNGTLEPRIMCERQQRLTRRDHLAAVSTARLRSPLVAG